MVIPSKKAFPAFHSTHNCYTDFFSVIFVCLRSNSLRGLQRRHGPLAFQPLHLLRRRRKPPCLSLARTRRRRPLPAGLALSVLHFPTIQIPPNGSLSYPAIHSTANKRVRQICSA